MITLGGESQTLDELLAIAHGSNRSVGRARDRIEASRRVVDAFAEHDRKGSAKRTRVREHAGRTRSAKRSRVREAAAGVAAADAGARRDPRACRYSNTTRRDHQTSPSPPR
jgi:hypothetical protein